MRNYFFLLSTTSLFSISEFYAILEFVWGFFPPGYKKAQRSSKLGFAMSALSSLQHILCMRVLAA